VKPRPEVTKANKPKKQKSNRRTDSAARRRAYSKHRSNWRETRKVIDELLLFMYGLTALSVGVAHVRYNSYPRNSKLNSQLPTPFLSNIHFCTTTPSGRLMCLTC